MRQDSFEQTVYCSAPRRLAAGQGGFGMIEVLISVLVLAIGLLGMASLQSNGIQMTTGALSRTQAVLLAEDLIERARANRASVGSYGFALGSAPSCDLTYEIANSSVATDDVGEWRNSVSCLLPGGDASVAVSGNVMTISVRWEARSGETTDGAIEVEADI
ncbi:type IV pilus modification protein PilV [Marinobacter gelidimuriae]|uniref:type IV pilus modification protein PilV n=1 Tax=Marinobacter gelidimuriae TaxID=2739064 RepID=UPI0003804110|nr:type IV pilus modification protein PilV [Marinobacter gelidimuriae]